ncbi:MAG: DNA-directed RNA polymerase subunit omega [Deltaproteobacteria bacterium]|nr:DNA-directed RNA polymerase subunit omega [Deltaproteobacteria bacterium]
MARVSIEDCLKKIPSRFALTKVAANRTRQLMGSAKPLVKSSNKAAVTALREISSGKIIMKGDPEAFLKESLLDEPIALLDQPIVQVAEG